MDNAGKATAKGEINLSVETFHGENIPSKDMANMMPIALTCWATLSEVSMNRNEKVYIG